MQVALSLSAFASIVYDSLLNVKKNFVLNRGQQFFSPPLPVRTLVSPLRNTLKIKRFSMLFIQVPK